MLIAFPQQSRYVNTYIASLSGMSLYNNYACKMTVAYCIKIAGKIFVFCVQKCSVVAERRAVMSCTTDWLSVTGSGELEFEEFVTLAARFLVEEDAEAMQQELREAFRLYDKEGKFLVGCFTLLYRDLLCVNRIKFMYKIGSCGECAR